MVVSIMDFEAWFDAREDELEGLSRDEVQEAYEEYRENFKLGAEDKAYEDYRDKQDGLL